MVHNLSFFAAFVLQASNFAKLGGTDTFNFGIPLEKINKFMNWPEE